METPEFIKRQYVEFRKIYRNWFKELSDAFPEQKKVTVKYYKDHMEDEHRDLLESFFNQASPYFETISNLENSFFDNCGTFYSVIEYDKMMATEKGKTEEYRKVQLGYLNKLCYMSILLHDISSKEKKEENKEENKEEDQSTPLLIKFLTNIQTLDGTNMEDMMKNFENSFRPENFNDADKAFINDNPLLSELAEEISKEVKIPESFKNITNPKDILKVMFNKEGKEFMEEMVKTVGGKIQTKIKSGQINEKDLFNQAQKMMGSVFNNPMFSAMGGMAGMAGMSGMPGMASPNEEEKKAKLRSKMKDKLNKNKGN
jgi:hypothetical protein